MPYYSELGIYTPSISYTNPLLKGPYASHSSILASNILPPSSKQYSRSQFRGGFKPHLTTISESNAPLRRISSPKVIYHSSPKVKVPRPIKINTSDIDVSLNRYRKYSPSQQQQQQQKQTKPKQPPEAPAKQEAAPVEKEAKPSKEIRRDRPTVRLQTIHQDTLEKEIGQIRSWRDNFQPNELVMEEAKRRKKTPGEILKEKFLIRSKSKENVARLEPPLPPTTAPALAKPARKLSVKKSPSFKDICDVITSDQAVEDLNPGQPYEVRRRQSRQLSHDDLIKEIKRSSSTLSVEDVQILDALLQAEQEMGLYDSPPPVKRKSTKKSSAKRDVEENLPTTRLRKESSLKDMIKDISQVEIESIPVKHKPVITGYIGSFDETPKNNLKAVVEDLDVQESPKANKKKEKKFRFNVTVQEFPVKKKITVPKCSVEGRGAVRRPAPLRSVAVSILKKSADARVGQVADEKPLPKKETKSPSEVNESGSMHSDFTVKVNRSEEQGESRSNEPQRSSSKLKIMCIENAQDSASEAPKKVETILKSTRKDLRTDTFLCKPGEEKTAAIPKKPFGNQGKTSELSETQGCNVDARNGNEFKAKVTSPVAKSVFSFDKIPPKQTKANEEGSDSKPEVAEPKSPISILSRSKTDVKLESSKELLDKVTSPVAKKAFSFDKTPEKQTKSNEEVAKLQLEAVEPKSPTNIPSHIKNDVKIESGKNLIEKVTSPVARKAFSIDKIPDQQTKTNEEVAKLQLEAVEPKSPPNLPSLVKNDVKIESGKNLTEKVTSPVAKKAFAFDKTPDQQIKTNEEVAKLQLEAVEPKSPPNVPRQIKNDVKIESGKDLIEKVTSPVARKAFSFDKIPDKQPKSNEEVSVEAKSPLKIPSQIKSDVKIDSGKQLIEKVSSPVAKKAFSFDKAPENQTKSNQEVAKLQLEAVEPLNAPSDIKNDMKRGSSKELKEKVASPTVKKAFLLDKNVKIDEPSRIKKEEEKVAEEPPGKENLPKPSSIKEVAQKPSLLDKAPVPSTKPPVEKEPIGEEPLDFWANEPVKDSPPKLSKLKLEQKDPLTLIKEIQQSHQQYQQQFPVEEPETPEEREMRLISKRSLIQKANKSDPDLRVFEPPTPPPPKEPTPPPEQPTFVPLQSNRLSQWMHPWKKPDQEDECSVEIFAKPKFIRARHIPRRWRHDDDEDDDDESEDSTTTSDDSEEEDADEEEADGDGEGEEEIEGEGGRAQTMVGASTSSTDSGFDSGKTKAKECDVNCHRKCEKLMANLCGINQKLVVEAIEKVRKGSVDNRDSPGGGTLNPASNPAFSLDLNDLPEEVSQSSTYQSFQKSGRITPPATTIPRFRKYCVDDFNFLKVLGKGSFGKVLLAELKGTEYYYAIKCLKKDVVLEDDDVECTLIERKVLALGTKHPYLCHLLCTFQTESHLFFVMEYLNGGDLMFHIQAERRFSEARARFYGAEIVSGLRFLHNKGIVYRDLKLDNILLDFDGHVRIADFGMCKLQIFLDRMADTFCGTPDYMAPEIIKGQHYNQCVDWWSFGVLLYEMLLGQSPFSGSDEDELFWSICNEKPVIPRFLSNEAGSVLVQFLEKDANKRLGNRFSPHGDIQDHAFFKPIDWAALEARQLEPPFKPNLQHPLDTQYFDKTFTVEKAKLTPIEGGILQSMDQTQFQGFSYTNPNATDK